MWILDDLSRPRNLPIVNVVAVVSVLYEIIPVSFAREALRRPGRPGGAPRRRHDGRPQGTPRRGRALRPDPRDRLHAEV